MRATSGASTKRRAAVGVDHDPVEDVLALVVEHAVDRADLRAVGGMDGHAARERQIADLVVVVLGHGLEG